MTSFTNNNPASVERARWSGSRCACSASAAALLLATASLAQAQGDGLSVRPSVELYYTATAGQVFELQGSTDLKHWRHVGDVVFGAGESVSDYVPPAGSDTGAFNFFRIKISTPQEFGFAPGYLPGRQIYFNDEGSATRFDFSSRSAGNAAGEGFAYSYRKMGDTAAQLAIEYGAGEGERIELDFSANLVGTYTRTSLSDGSTKDIDRGTFSLTREPQPSTGPPATTAPDSLVGHTYLFSDGDSHERLDFVSGTSGRAIDRADVRHFGYEYTALTDSGKATISYPGDISVEFEMHFGGSACGSFERREYFDGSLESTSEGVFSCASSVYHPRGAGSTDATLPANALTGRTFVMRDGGTPCQLRFQTENSGKCTRGRQVDDFGFEYVVNGNATSTITIRFAAGDYDRYHLNHSDQIFVRHEVRGGVEIDTDSGSFSEAP